MRLPRNTEVQPHMDSLFCMNYLYANIYIRFEELKEQFKEASRKNKLIFLSHTFQAMYGYMCSDKVDSFFVENLLNQIKELIDDLEYDSDKASFNKFYNNIFGFFNNIEKYKLPNKKIPHIIILMGNPGSGKSYIARTIAKENTNIEVIKKYSTRPKRKDEEGGVVETEAGCTPEFIQTLEYQSVFEMRGERNLFGCSKTEIENALKKGKNPVIATTDLAFYEKILNDFPCQTHIVLIDNPIYNDDQQIEIFKKQGRDSKEIENRIGLRTMDDVHKYDYNLRTIVNPIQYIRKFSEEENRNFIFTQLKYIIENFGGELDLELGKSELLEDFDEFYLTQFRNTKYLYPYISGRYDEDMDDYVPIDDEPSAGIPKI